MLVFFGTLCIRPATKSKISARALTREETASLVRKTVGFVGETLISALSLVKKDLKKKESGWVRLCVGYLFLMLYG